MGKNSFFGLETVIEEWSLGLLIHTRPRVDQAVKSPWRTVITVKSLERRRTHREKESMYSILRESPRSSLEIGGFQNTDAMDFHGCG